MALRGLARLGFRADEADTTISTKLITENWASVSSLNTLSWYLELGIAEARLRHDELRVGGSSLKLLAQRAGYKPEVARFVSVPG